MVIAVVGTLRKPGRGERVRRRQSSLLVFAVLFVALAPSLVFTKVIGQHEPWSFWGYAAHVVVLAMAPALAIGLIRLVENRLRRSPWGGPVAARRMAARVRAAVLPPPVDRPDDADGG